MTDSISALNSMITALGLSREEVIASLADAPVESGTDRPTLHEFVARLSGTFASEGTARGFRTHFERLCSGVARQCDCTCNTCLDEFSDLGTCRCTRVECGCARATSFPALGDLTVQNSNFQHTVLAPLPLIARRMSTKRSMLHNRTRVTDGKAPRPVHGQGGQEMCVTALRFLFAAAVSDELMTTNPAMKLPKGRRSESIRRAITSEELEELFTTVATGGDDPDLDLAIVWTLSETAGRAEGLLTATVGSIRRATQMIVLLEKGNLKREQPISAELIAYLFDLAVERGGPAFDPNDAGFDPNAPLFLYRDSTFLAPHALSRKRFETLFSRIQRTLPWAAECGFSAHAMRYTTAVRVERAFGTQVARKYLGHGKRRPIDTYTDPSQLEMANAFESVTGFVHPGASASAGLASNEQPITGQPTGPDFGGNE